MPHFTDAESRRASLAKAKEGYDLLSARDYERAIGA